MTKKSFPQARCETRLISLTYAQLVERKIIFINTPVNLIIHRLCIKRVLVFSLLSCPQKNGTEKIVMSQGISELSTGEKNKINKLISTAC